MDKIDLKNESQWVHIHRPPRICKMLLGPISTWSPKAQYLYKRSFERYLKDPKRKRLHQTLKSVIKDGEIGTIESFRFIGCNPGGG